MPPLHHIRLKERLSWGLLPQRQMLVSVIDIIPLRQLVWAQVQKRDNMLYNTNIEYEAEPRT
jgi:hypothetical protein